MPRPTPLLVIDARPSGPDGPWASELVLGQSLLARLLDQALDLSDSETVSVHARLDEHRGLQDLLGDRPADRLRFQTGAPPENSAVLRTDRLYDIGRLRRALRRGQDPDSAVIWRLDGPQSLRGAGDELVRRQTYQPLGRYWALAPTPRGLARLLRPTRVRPNALTAASGVLILCASAAVAWWPMTTLGPCLAISLALALSLVLDTADGHLARLQGTASPFGRWLDAVLDELGDMALHAAIAWAAYVRDAEPAWLVLGILYAMGKYLFQVVNATWETQRIPKSDESANATPRTSLAAEGRLSRWVRLAGHADIRWHLWIVLALFGRLDLGLAVYAFYFPIRALGAAIRKGAAHA